MGILDDPLDRHSLEQLRRSLAMLQPGQKATIERERAIALIEEIERLQGEQRRLAVDLGAIVDRLHGVARHPAAGATHPPVRPA